ncbi:aspartic protease [Rickenella mellea]|uniref:Aspartic protease n=1 Tax=Rickenella mellea TaxID=50990 RepID=A0A4Y7Q2E8_9AGAM|nr:aspartic protease [Rickenella mellea]
MFPASTLVSTLMLAIAVAAGPVNVIRDSGITLPFAAKLKLNGSSIADVDRSRAAALKGRFSKRASSFPVTNTAVVYSASVGVGSPATQYNLLIDTGSSNTWIGAGTAYKKTSTSTDTGKKVSVSYGSGSFSGEEFTDTVTLSSSLVITKQSIGVASTSTGFDGFDGILGIGPVDLTQGTLSGSSATVPTVTDNLFSQGKISVKAVGVSFAPTTVQSTTNGELTFGGPDTSKFTGTLSYVGLTSTSPASAYWGIDQTITYSTSTSILSKTAGIVDTGTTLVLLATDAFNKYKTASKATADSATGLLKITSANYANLKSLFFTIGSTKYELTANAQTWPRSLNTFIGGTSGSIYLIVADLGSNSGSGLDFINGFTFLERFYTVYDTTNSRFGIATTSSTTATSN